MRISGFASTDHRDREGDVILSRGIDMEHMDKRVTVDFDASHPIGKLVNAIVRKCPDGMPGLWVTIDLPADAPPGYSLAIGGVVGPVERGAEGRLITALKRPRVALVRDNPNPHVTRLKGDEDALTRGEVAALAAIGGDGV